jgi:hypothetical protein
MLKMAVFAAIAIATVRITAPETTGERRIVRPANWIFFRIMKFCP